ncbi:MAG: MarR family transcriptional regulator, partial [Alphaproteobacteria bacterium]|nr:MarR family transcriptional regulator [Alphaproteobacteria bacterium]
MNEPQPREGPVRIHPLTALSAFRQVAVDMLGGGGGDLSWRQTAVLLTIYLTPGPHSVGGLARARGL